MKKVHQEARGLTQVRTERQELEGKTPSVLALVLDNGDADQDSSTMGK